MDDLHTHNGASRAAPSPAPGAVVLCRCRDEYGEIIVKEAGSERTLAFGGGTVQSTIRTDRPELLLEDYHQAMMTALLFPGEVRRALMIGLGGCSLVHFLRSALPACALDVVELRRQVISLSREYFLLPAQDAGLRIVHASGRDFVASRGAGPDRYDLIIVDAFDEAGPAACLRDRAFLSACRSLLSGGGVLVLNAWNGPGHGFPALYDAVQDAFGNAALKLLLSESYRNAVILGFRQTLPGRDLAAYRSRAAELKDRLGIDAPRYLRQLYWQNFDPRDQ